MVTFRGEARDMCAKGPPSAPTTVPSGHFKQYRIEYCPRTPGTTTPPASGWILVDSSTTPNDPGSVLGTWATSSVADGSYWLRLVVTDLLVDATGGAAQARQALIDAHTNVVYKRVWIENQRPAFTLAVKYDGQYRAGGQVCNLINPVLVVECGHVAESAIQVSNVWLRYGEEAGHAGQLLGPVQRTANYTTEQLADGAYRRVYSIAEGGCGATYGILSCGYHNGAWTLSTNGQTIQYVWFDHASGVFPAPVTVEHRNLVITDLQTSSPRGWFVFNPDTYDPGNKPRVQFALDKLTNEQATATLAIFQSDDSWHPEALVRILAAPVATQGTYTIEWDGRDQVDRMAPWGVYVFWLTVQSNAIGDSDSDKSDSLSARTHGVDLVYDEDGVFRHRHCLRYTLEDSHDRAASACALYVYNPALAEYGPQAGETGLGTHETIVTCQSDLAGTYIFLVAPTDDRADAHKGHRRRPAMQCNAQGGKPAAVNIGQGAFARQLRSAWQRQQACGYGSVEGQEGVVLNTTAVNARDKLTQVAIYCYYSHGPGISTGAMGRVYFPRKKPWLWGKGEAVAVNPAEQCLLVVFVGCGIAEADGTSLLEDICDRLGADAGVGFGTTNIHRPWGDAFMATLWRELSRGKTISEAADIGLDALGDIPPPKVAQESASEEQMVKRGNVSMVITPAAWGR